MGASRVEDPPIQGNAESERSATANELAWYAPIASAGDHRHAALVQDSFRTEARGERSLQCSAEVSVGASWGRRARASSPGGETALLLILYVVLWGSAGDVTALCGPRTEMSFGRSPTLGRPCTTAVRAAPRPGPAAAAIKRPMESAESEESEE